MPIGLDAVLLFILSLPGPLLFRISPGDTPYWLFGVYFILLIFYILVDQKILFHGSEASVWKVKFIIASGVIAIAAGGPLISSVITRIGAPPEFEVHDIILQLESAMRFLLDGKNPYAATYFGTPMEKWQYAELGKQAINPALYHFVMPPWYLLFPFFFYVPFISFFGFFDGRIPLLFTFFATLVLFFVWVKDPLKRMLLIILTAFHPVLFSYLREGRSDHFAFFWFSLAVFLFHKKKWVLGSIVFALALGSKQTIWLSVPFILLFLWYQIPLDKKKHFFTALVTMAITGGLLVVPFLLWDANAFFQSTVGFLMGNVAHSYPISGYGLGMLLYQFGIIKDIHAYYPFIFWQVALGGPVLVFLLRWFWRRPSASRLYISYGLFLFIFWYLSRYFNNSHIGYISLVLMVGYFL